MRETWNCSTFWEDKPKQISTFGKISGLILYQVSNDWHQTICSSYGYIPNGIINAKHFHDGIFDDVGLKPKQTFSKMDLTLLGITRKGPCDQNQRMSGEVFTPANCISYRPGA